MKISLCNEVVGALDFAAQCALASALGYDGLEVAPFTLDPEPHRLAAARRAELRRIAADHSLQITGLHWLLVTPDGLSITSRDAATRGRTVDVMRRLIELCIDLGGTILVHGSPKQRPIEPGDGKEIVLARAAECFAAVAADAEQARVTYCIEPLAPSETRLINTVEEAAALVQAIGSPAVRTMIDCCAAGNAESVAIPELIERWLPTGLIAHIHLNDPNRHAPGQGDLRFGPILAALEDHGYAGICAVEPFVYKPDGPSCAARAIGYLRGLEEALARRSPRLTTV
jgi:D-psicose/D-tagatose/L-ribulose 3-epimerase